jgi:hypothetical protein
MPVRYRITVARKTLPTDLVSESWQADAAGNDAGLGNRVMVAPRCTPRQRDDYVEGGDLTGPTVVWVCSRRQYKSEELHFRYPRYRSWVEFRNGSLAH